MSKERLEGLGRAAAARRKRLHNSLTRIPRWLSYFLFTAWMMIFGLVVLFLVTIFWVCSSSADSVLLWNWCDVVFHLGAIWIIGVFTFFGVLVVWPPRHALRS